MAAQPNRAHDIAIGKDEGRDSRLKVTNFLEEKVRREWKKMSMDACENFVRKYWVCRNEQGLMVVFKCRKEFNEMNACLLEWNKDPAKYEEYKNKRLPQLEELFSEKRDEFQRRKDEALAKQTSPSSR